MAGRKVFVSYKYWDTEVEYLPGYSTSYAKVRDYVDYIEDRFSFNSDYIYKGEHDEEDLSDKSDDYIWEKLKPKIYDSSVTIVFVSPKMRESIMLERNQWIPQEISYSLKEIPRGGYTSRTNAVLAVVLPDRYGSYSYFENLRLFRILSENIENGYIPVTNWNNFIRNIDLYINFALAAKTKVLSYRIRKIP